MGLHKVTTKVPARGKTVVVNLRNGLAPANRTKPICKSSCLVIGNEPIARNYQRWGSLGFKVKGY